MSVKNLSIDLIRTDGGTQMRAELTSEVYLDYRDKWLSGVEFDPVDVFYDGATYWLAEGFHRFYGAREAKRKDLPCRVHSGTQRDAILFACSANATHGLRRSPADKRKAIETLLKDDEWGGKSQRWIAEKAAVDDKTVASVKRELESTAEIPQLQVRTGKDNKKRRHPSAKPKKARSQSDELPSKAENDATKKHNDTFKPEEFDKPKQGRAKGFDEEESKTAFRELSQEIDKRYNCLLAIYEMRWNEVGGNAQAHDKAIRAAKIAQGKSHDAINDALGAYKTWRDSK